MFRLFTKLFVFVTLLGILSCSPSNPLPTMIAAGDWTLADYSVDQNYMNIVGYQQPANLVLYQFLHQSDCSMAGVQLHVSNSGGAIITNTNSCSYRNNYNTLNGLCGYGLIGFEGWPTEGDVTQQIANSGTSQLYFHQEFIAGAYGKYYTVSFSGDDMYWVHSITVGNVTGTRVVKWTKSCPTC